MVLWWYTDYNKSNQIDPLQHSSRKYRVVRGGSWFVNSHNVRIFNRYNNLPTATVSDVGFRLVKTLVKNKEKYKY
ncbi:SUMF1/EgtB/PvdO family nonheme iron enzyme [Oceanotoga teriensis]|jgi:formylglycine-generating enzyme required for sulfatase activity|uniref:SUMF1/EgtB/PvdO family nonheme iron enzyme n=1 Tax=Oceanotoga teriensis TaxID=515440 RepID=UPI00352EBE9B